MGQPYFLSFFSEKFLLLYSSLISLLLFTSMIFFYKKILSKRTDAAIQYKALFQQNPDAVFIIGADGIIIECNDSVAHMLGFSSAELIGQPFHTLLQQESHHISAERFNRSLSGFATKCTVISYHKKGKKLILRLKFIPFSNEKSAGVYIIAHDHTESEQLKASLQETTERLKSFFNSTLDAINITNIHGELLYVNPSFEKMYGWKEEELIGKPLPIIPVTLREEEDARKALLLEGRSISNWQAQLVRKDGSMIETNITISPLRNTNGEIEGFAAITRDETKRKKERQQYEMKLKRLAYYDPLTGAGNRRLFQKRLQSALEEARENNSMFALFYLDCDRFKWVNDTMGHDIGDELLVQFADRIQSTLGTAGTVSRLGGDEFAVILTNIQSKDAIIEKADKLIRMLQYPWDIQDHHFVTTSSIGISIYPFDGEDSHCLISHADHALYQAKQDGRNLYRFCTNSLKEKMDRIMLLENDLKYGISDEQFHLVFQPQVNLRTGITECVEVLLRYTHPVLGNVPPDEFIPICEKTGIINDITSWIIEETGKQYKKLLINGFMPVKFAINISPVSLQNEKYYEQLLAALKISEIPPGYLELELTEQAFLDELQEVKIRLAEIKTLGISVALDDFGSGYSSLVYFKQLPIDKVKIDKRFIQDIYNKDGEKDRAIVKTILSLTNELRLNLVCEGVETLEQSQYLVNNQFLLAQGYYFSKPIPGELLMNSGMLKTKVIKGRFPISLDC